MKPIKIMTLCCFALILVLPVLFFNFEENVASQIDNRMLAPNPLTAQGDLTDNVDNYVKDRIGFRNEMILGYTVLNDRLFGKMVHPSYYYGKDGYVYGAGGYVYEPYTDYHEQFADAVKAMQDYCEARDVPFLFVLNPAKPAVLEAYLPVGRAYDRKWVDQFLRALEERGVRYLDNTVTLKERTEAGETVFNQKYDANHWNALGAYYGVDAVLRELATDVDGIYITPKDSLTISSKVETTLMVSKFPIHEEVPVITLDQQPVWNGEGYWPDLSLHSSYNAFFSYTNSRPEATAKGLVFQGSYINGYGYPFFAAGFGEYVGIHDYQNVFDLSYYFNIFQPDCVVFEVAEYTFNETYFSTEKMKSMVLNPALEDVRAQQVEKPLQADSVTIEQTQRLAILRWDTQEAGDHGWLVLDKPYDLQKTETGWQVTLDLEDYEAYAGDRKFCLLCDDILTYYIP